MREAEFAFIRRRLNEAANLCREAIRINRGNARAHAILGDVYRVQGRREQAILEYSYAVQFNPGDRDSQTKLEKLLPRGARRRPAQAARRRRRKEEYQDEIRSAKNAANMAAWGLAFFLLFLINVYPGRPIPGLAFFSQISTWSWSLIALLAADAALVGALLSANRVLADPDEELLFQHVPGTMIPVGFPLLVFSAVFFYAAAGGLILLNVLQGIFSKSLMCLFAAVTAITLLAALMYEPGHLQVALYGGNAAFPAAVLGWYIGRLFGPLEK